MRQRDAERIARLIDRNVDDLYADRKTHEDMSTRNGILWRRAVAMGVQEAVLIIFNARRHARKAM